MKRLIFVTTIALLSIGCGPAVTPQAGAPSLAAAAAIDALEPSLGSRITMSARGQLVPSKSPVEVPVQAVQLRLRSGDRPMVEALDLALQDTDVSPAALPPRGLKLRNLHLFIEHAVPAEVRVAEADRLEVTAEAPLVLKWALLLDDGTLWPLGAQPTVPLALDLRAERSGGATMLTLEARCAGTCWSVDGVGDLDDAVVTVETSAEVSVR